MHGSCSQGRNKETDPPRKETSPYTETLRLNKDRLPMEDLLKEIGQSSLHGRMEGGAELDLFTTGNPAALVGAQVGQWWPEAQGLAALGTSASQNLQGPRMVPASQDPDVSQQEAKTSKESPRSCLRKPAAWLEPARVSIAFTPLQSPGVKQEGAACGHAEVTERKPAEPGCSFLALSTASALKEEFMDPEISRTQDTHY